MLQLRIAPSGLHYWLHAWVEIQTIKVSRNLASAVTDPLQAPVRQWMFFPVVFQ
jgi:hypothetical protein